MSKFTFVFPTNLNTPLSEDGIDGSPQFACVLFLERASRSRAQVDKREAEKESLFVRLLDYLVVKLQPSPALLHAELVLISHSGECNHFATYLFDKARWRQSGSEYYSSNQWRALPLDGTDAVKQMALRCDQEENAPYSIWKYPLATRPFRALAKFCSERPMASCHCASLTARIIRSVVGDRILPHRAAQYSPSTLYNEMCANIAEVSIDVPAGETVMSDAQILSQGTDAEVEVLGPLRRAFAMKHIGARLRSQVQREGNTMAVDESRALAWAIVRATKKSDPIDQKGSESDDETISQDALLHNSGRE